MPNIEQDLILAGLKSAEDPANKAAILAEIGTLEGGAEAAVIGAINGAERPKSFPLSILWPVIVKDADAIATAFVAQHGPEVIFDFLDLLGHKVAGA